MFAAAAEAFAVLVAQVGHDQLDGPGLGEWDLRSLIGHGSRSLVTVDTYLDRPAPVEQLRSPVDYVATALTGTDPAAITERGRQAGLALGDDPAAAVRALVDRVVPRVAAAPDRLIETIAGGMRLETYLRTRTFELVVHALDVARAADLPTPDYPPALLEEVTGLAAAVAVRRGHAVPLLLALTGREALPPDFSMV
jgi:hypothetical protein